MKKILVTFPRKNRKSVSVGGQDISVAPYISIALQSFLIGVFLDDCFDSENESFVPTAPFDRIAGNLSFNLALLDKMTNLDILSEEMDLDEVIGSGVMDKIISKIENYDEVIALRETVLQDFIKERYSIAGIVKSFASIDQGDIENMGTAIKSLQEKVEDSPLKELFKEAK